MAKGQECLIHQKLEDAGQGPLRAAVGGSLRQTPRGPATPRLQTLASRAMRRHDSVALSHLVCGHLCRQCWDSHAWATHCRIGLDPCTGGFGNLTGLAAGQRTVGASGGVGAGVEGAPAGMGVPLSPSPSGERPSWGCPGHRATYKILPPLQPRAPAGGRVQEPRDNMWTQDVQVSKERSLGSLGRGSSAA